MPALHPDCLAYLEDLRELSMPAATPEQVRARYRFLCRRYAGPPIGVRVEDAGGPAPMRLYGEGERLLVWFHGGRMVSGDLETHDWLCRALARESGGRVLAVDYRLAPEHRFPAALEDASAALRFARTLSGKVAAGGDSAGAALALAAALDEPNPLAGLVLIYPMIDATCSLPSHREFENGPGTSGRDIALGYDWWLPTDADRRDARVSPLHAAGFEKLPRTLVVTCGVDPLRDEGLALVERLSAARLEVEHVHYATLLHGFLTYPARFAAAHDAGAEIAAFVRG
jgi:acetyl esterase